MARKDKAATLQRLADACPEDLADIKLRLGLMAITAAASADPDPKLKSVDVLRKLVKDALADQQSAREDHRILTDYSSRIAGYVTAPNTPERVDLVARMDEDFDRFATDDSISNDDHISAVMGKVQLARMDEPRGPLPDALMADVRQAVKRVDHETTSPSERLTVISFAGEVLNYAGLPDESDALYKAELTRSLQPYYLMLDLARNAEAYGDKTAALGWYEKAYTAAEGPATRLELGVDYVDALIDLSPGDDARILKAVKAVVAELNVAPDTFFGSSLHSLQSMAKKLIDWDAQARHGEALDAVQDELTAICGKLPAKAPEKSSCERVFVRAANG